DGDGPVEISAEAPWPPHPDAVGLWRSVRMRYLDGDTLILYSGEWGDPEPGGTPLIEGPKGKLYQNYRTDPPGLMEELDGVPDPEPLIDFHTAVRTRRKSGGNEVSSHSSCTLVNLANIAIRTGRTLRWDPAREELNGDEVAQRLVDQPMTSPWHL
ncbi:MAG: gfo/Idh/MocA family oxidoreductase, partial [Planctomycetota bacterium]